MNGGTSSATRRDSSTVSPIITRSAVAAASGASSRVRGPRRPGDPRTARRREPRPALRRDLAGHRLGGHGQDDRGEPALGVPLLDAARRLGHRRAGVAESQGEMARRSSLPAARGRRSPSGSTSSAGQSWAARRLRRGERLAQPRRRLGGRGLPDDAGISTSTTPPSVRRRFTPPDVQLSITAHVGHARPAGRSGDRPVRSAARRRGGRRTRTEYVGAAAHGTHPSSPRGPADFGARVDFGLGLDRSLELEAEEDRDRLHHRRGPGP